MSLLLLLLLSASTQLATDAAAFMPLQNLGAVHLQPIATALPLHHRPLRTRSKFGFRMLLPGEGQGAGAAADVQDHECIEWRFIRHNQWHCYDANASRLLEAALAAGENSATLSLNTSSSASTSPGGACEYVVTFDSPDSGTFSQVNIHSGHIRAVRRAPASAFCQPVVPEFDLAPRLEPMITAALSNAEPLLLRGGTFVLREEVRLGANGAHLRIRGPGKILGDGHTLFKVGGNRARLDAEDVEFVHVASPTRRQRRELGAAVFVLGKAEATLVNCTLTSEQGFGLWLSQKACVLADGCRFAQCGRSAVVLFGRATLDLKSSNITSAGMHGICARGNTRVKAKGCHVADAATRGIFAYENATLELAGCSITGTRHPGLASLQVESLQTGDSATLKMDAACTFRANLGADVHVAGAVCCSPDVERVYGARAAQQPLGTPRARSHRTRAQSHATVRQSWALVDADAF